MTITLAEDTASAPRTFADVEEILRGALLDYEPRRGQQALAAKIEETIAEESSNRTAATDPQTGDLHDEYYPKHLLGQAPTGTGKSLGYLIPALLSGKRYAVSVTTKALQHQLVGKDIPFLEKHLPFDFTWAELRGRANYICFNIADAADAPAPSLARIRAYAAEHPEFSGLRDDLPFEIPDTEWYSMHGDSEGCRDANCSSEVEGEENCFATIARRRAKAADLVIINHALLCTELTLQSLGIESQILVARSLVIDEAHDLQEVAANSLGYQLRERTFTTLVDDLRSFYVGITDNAEGIDRHCAAVTGAAVTLFEKLESIKQIAEGKETVVRLKDDKILENSEELLALSGALDNLKAVWDNTYFEFAHPRERTRKNRIDSRLKNARVRLLQVIVDKQIDLVRWVSVEKTRRGERFLAINAAPVSVAEFLNRYLWSQISSVLVSATLVVNRKFTFLADNLGIADAAVITVPSPFDFAHQGKLYVPRLPAPTGDTQRRAEAASTEEIYRLIQASEGRALVLFTSRRRMLEVAESMRARAGFTYPLLVQGELPNPELSRRFKEETSSVLFGLKSYMTGVDFQGETLSLLILDKMPFLVPTEPITQARCERIEAFRGNGFFDYCLPQMNLLIQQAVGRLIRHTTDIGCVAILDSRLTDKGYGAKIVKDLPPFPLTRDFADVEEFFAER